MGEILGAAIVVFAVVAAITAGLYYFHDSGRQRTALSRAPAILLPPGESPDVLLANARRTYVLMQRSARVFDRVVRAEVLTNEDRHEIQEILDDFYYSNN